MNEVIEKYLGLSLNLYIDGKYTKSSSSSSFDVVDPATEIKIGEIAEATSEEINSSIEISKKAQKAWWNLSALERAHLMHKVADKMIAMKPILAEGLTREMGKPYKESADEVDWSAHSIRYSAEIGRSDTGRVMGPAVEGQFHYTLKQPLGTAVLILPFNYPLVLLAWEAGAALAAGNSVIIKASEYTTLTTLFFSEAFSELPSGTFQVITGSGKVGQALVEHEDTNVIAFTGSVPVGRSVAKTCGDLMKPCLIENSGNDPFLVMPSAPIDIAARAASFSAFMNCGQICVSAERFFVHEKIYDEFLDKFIVEAKKVRVGNGLNKVDMGPMVSSKERARYETLITTAKNQGAQAVTGGGRPSEFNRGWFVEPTILAGCDVSMEIFNNESFGPVAPICKVSSFEEGIALANDSKYGLGANIYTMNLSEGIIASEQLQAGMVWVNAPLLDNDAGPFGGSKLSGLGRQLGPEGLETFRETKTVMIDPNCNPQDFWWFPYSDNESYEEK